MLGCEEIQSKFQAAPVQIEPFVRLIHQYSLTWTAQMCRTVAEVKLGTRTPQTRALPQSKSQVEVQINKYKHKALDFSDAKMPYLPWMGHQVFLLSPPLIISHHHKKWQQSSLISISSNYSLPIRTDGFASLGLPKCSKPQVLLG